MSTATMRNGFDSGSARKRINTFGRSMSATNTIKVRIDTTVPSTGTVGLPKKTNDVRGDLLNVLESAHQRVEQGDYDREEDLFR